MSMNTLHEIAISLANKQPGMIDSVTENAPILDRAKFIPSSHGLWDLSEKLTDITGPGFIALDSALPEMSASSDLVHTDLMVLGGKMEVGSDKAMKLGGPEKYFASKQEAFLKQAGMDLEKMLALDMWLKAAKDNKMCVSAGGTGKGWFLLAVRFDDLSNVGLYDADQFESGRFFKITLPYGGQEHYIRGNEGVLGYTIVYKSILGWKLHDPKRTVSAIVNIDEEHAPTASMIDDMLADVRCDASNTVIICGMRGKVYGINPHKASHVYLVNGDKDMQTSFESWGGIPIIVSHNFNSKIDNVKPGYCKPTFGRTQGAASSETESAG